jgi:hypothetical protein
MAAYGAVIVAAAAGIFLTTRTMQDAVTANRADSNSGNKGSFPPSGTVVLDPRLTEGQLTNTVTVIWGKDETARSAVLKLRDAQSGFVIGTGYVTAGGTVTIKAPAGAYALWLATGNKWSGVRDLYGPSTLVTATAVPLILTHTSLGAVNHTLRLNDPSVSLRMISKPVTSF